VSPGRISPLALVLIAGVAGAALFGLAAAQDLGSAARREQERRQREKPSGSAGAATYTEADLNKGKLPPCVPPTPTPPPRVVAPPGWTFATPTPSATPPCATPAPVTAPAAGGPPTTEAPDARGTEDYWRSRASRARAAITDAEANVRQLETRVAGLRNDMSPVGTNDPNRLQTREAELGRAITELEAAQRSVTAAQQALADLEEEARRKGVPPGWLR